jgi:hypothetical protein
MNGPVGEVVGLALQRRTADRQQAEYFRRVLDDQRTQVQQELARDSSLLAKYQHAGDLSGVRRMRRVVRARETELITLDRLIDALNQRFARP